MAKLKARSHEVRCNLVSMRIRSECDRMHIDHVHMAQQLSRFEANGGERGCHK